MSRILRRRPAAALLVPLCLLLLVAAPVSAQSVQEVADRMRTHYRQWTENVRTLTTVSRAEESVVAFDSMLTFQERTGGGTEPTYETESRILGGRPDLPPELHENARLDFLTTYREIYRLFSDSTEYLGTESLEGSTVHVLEVTSLTSFYDELMATGGQQPYQMTAENGRFYVDAQSWVVRRVEMDVTIHRRDQPHTVQAITRLEDYRTIDGLPYPHRITTEMRNMVSASEQERMRQRVSEIEKQLEGLSEQRRRQMEKTMGDQLERMRELMDGTVEMAIVVESVTVNGARPAVLDAGEDS